LAIFDYGPFWRRPFYSLEKKKEKRASGNWWDSLTDKTKNFVWNT
jgi:hypothetical protein